MPQLATRPILLALTLLSPSALADVLSVAGSWQGMFADSTTNKACSCSFTVKQSSTAFAITPRTYQCDGYTLTQFGIDAALSNVDAGTQLMVVAGAGIGVIQATKLQFSTIENLGEGVWISAGGRPHAINVTETLADDTGAVHTLSGIGTLVGNPRD